jgi:hypothetical protein
MSHSLTTMIRDTNNYISDTNRSIKSNLSFTVNGQPNAVYVLGIFTVGVIGAMIYRSNGNPNIEETTPALVEPSENVFITPAPEPIDSNTSSPVTESPVVTSLPDSTTTTVPDSTLDSSNTTPPITSSSIETRTDETRTDETRTDETKPDETRTGETKPDETRTGETKPDETRTDETRTEEPPKLGGAKKRNTRKIYRSLSLYDGLL